MPLWRVFCNPGTFSKDQKAALARDVTATYKSLPAFYVNVIFIECGDDNIWIGGEAKRNFVRIVIEQIARQLPSEATDEGRAHRRRFMERINATLQPHFQARPELEWEHHIYETPRDLWRVGGIDPPPANSEAERVWKRENKAAPF